MANHSRGNNSRPPREPPIIPVGPWCIAKIKRYFHKRSTEREKETPQERSSRITANATWIIAIFAVVAAGVAISQAIISNRQLNAMQGQLDEMQAARRPWLTVDASITGPLTFNPTPQVPMKFVLTNIGPSPALEAWVNAAMFPLLGGDPVKEMHKRCEDMRKDSLAAQVRDARPPGYILFPNHTYETEFGLLVKPKDLDGWKKSSLGRVPIITLDIIVCGDYRFTFSPDVHSTRLLYTLATDPSIRGKIAIMEAGKNGGNVAIDPGIGTVDVHLFQEPFGDTYAN